MRFLSCCALSLSLSLREHRGLPCICLRPRLRALPNLSPQAPFASLRRPERFWSLPTPTDHLSRRDPTVNAVLRFSGALAPSLDQSNKLSPSVIVLLLLFVKQHFSSDHNLARNCSLVFCKVKSILTCTRFGSRRGPRGFLQNILSNPAYQRILLRTDTDTFCSTQPELSVILRFSRISLVVHWTSSCWAQTQNILAGSQRAFTNPSVLVVKPDTLVSSRRTHSELAFHGTRQCLAVSCKAPSSTTSDTSLPYAKTVSGSMDTLDSGVNT